MREATGKGGGTVEGMAGNGSPAGGCEAAERGEEASARDDQLTVLGFFRRLHDVKVNPLGHPLPGRIAPVPSDLIARAAFG